MLYPVLWVHPEESLVSPWKQLVMISGLSDSCSISHCAYRRHGGSHRTRDEAVLPLSSFPLQLFTGNTGLVLMSELCYCQNEKNILFCVHFLGLRGKRASRFHPVSVHWFLDSSSKSSHFMLWYQQLLGQHWVVQAMPPKNHSCWKRNSVGDSLPSGWGTTSVSLSKLMFYCMMTLWRSH